MNGFRTRRRSTGPISRPSEMADGSSRTGTELSNAMPPRGPKWTSTSTSRSGRKSSRRADANRDSSAGGHRRQNAAVASAGTSNGPAFVPAVAPAPLAVPPECVAGLPWDDGQR